MERRRSGSSLPGTTDGWILTQPTEEKPPACHSLAGPGQHLWKAEQNAGSRGPSRRVCVYLCSLTQKGNSRPLMPLHKIQQPSTTAVHQQILGLLMGWAEPPMRVPVPSGGEAPSSPVDARKGPHTLPQIVLVFWQVKQAPFAIAAGGN